MTDKHIEHEPATKKPTRRRLPSLRRGAADGSSPSRVVQGAGAVVARLPRMLSVATVRARRAFGVLETMPDGTLHSLAAASLGLGAGLSFTRAGRLGALVGALPAAVVGTVLLTRPTTTGDAAETGR